MRDTNPGDESNVSSLKSYALVDALRPFSLVVAFASCGLGIVLALPHAATGFIAVLAVMLGGLLLQCGVNLINDHEDLAFLQGEQFIGTRQQIKRNFRFGLLCFSMAAAIGFGLSWYSSYWVLIIGALGVFGAFAYTHEPLNLKRRGLGLVVVFLLMGVLMMQGTYIAITAQFSWPVILHSLPLSALISLLLLGNELRDLERDAAREINTLSVKLGYRRSVLLYWLLILGAYLATGLMIGIGELPASPWLLLPLPLLPLLQHYLSARDRSPLTPWSGRFLLLFGTGYALALS